MQPSAPTRAPDVIGHPSRIPDFSEAVTMPRLVYELTLPPRIGADDPLLVDHVRKLARRSGYHIPDGAQLSIYRVPNNPLHTKVEVDKATEAPCPPT